MSGWIVCVLDTIAQPCIQLPRRGSSRLLFVEVRRAAVLLFLAGILVPSDPRSVYRLRSEVQGPIFGSVGLAWPIDFPASTNLPKH